MANPPSSAYRVSPLETIDIPESVPMLNKAFDGETSRFQRAYYVEPYPTKDERNESYARRLEYGLRVQGKKAWKVQLERETVGVMVWQPPGVRYHSFEPAVTGPQERPSSRKTIEKGEVYEWIDPEGWNGLFGKMQDARDRIHQGRDCWYLELLAIHPSHQGRGLGKLLLQHLLDQLPHDMSAHLESSPEGLGLYKKLGFEVVDQLEAKGRDGGLIEAPVLVRWGKNAAGEK